MPKSRHAPSRSSPTRKMQRGRGSRLTTLQVGLLLALVVFVVAGAYFLFRPRTALPAEVQPSQAHAMYQAGASFVDVRTQSEWDQGHIARSLLIPRDELPDRLNELPRDNDIVVVCRSGARSKEGAAILRQAGFARVTCLAGGIQAWAAMGYRIQE